MTLNIVTSNIRYANPTDGKNDWEFRRPMLVSLLEDLNADILGTQEGREAQIRELASGLNSLELIAGHRDWIAERMYPCLFFNPKKISIIRSGDIWLSHTPSIPASKFSESSFPRLCVWAEIEIKETGTKLMIINTHLDHVLQDVRKMQARVLVSEINMLNNWPRILMGDFNEAPNTFIKEELINGLDLKDPWVEKGLAEETSHHSFKGLEASGDRIDWILIPKKFIALEIGLEKRSAAGVYPSDHYPLFATVIPK